MVLKVEIREECVITFLLPRIVLNTKSVPAFLSNILDPPLEKRKIKNG
jgi:hypothetical protein